MGALEVCRRISEYPELSRSAAKIGVFVGIMDDLEKDRTASATLEDFVKCVLEKSGMILVETIKQSGK